MKKIIISVIVLISLQITQAQEKLQIKLKENQTFSQAMRESMSLDTTKIPYQTLYDRVIGWSNLINWNSGDTTDFARLKQSWYDIEHSKNTVTNTLPVITDNMQMLLSKQIIPLINIDYKFAYINPYAIKRNALQIKNNRIVQTNAKSNFYSVKYVNMSGLALDEVSANVDYQIKLDKNLILSNLRSQQKKEYTILNITTRQEYRLTYNKPVKIKFTKPGINVLKFILHTHKGDFITYQQINVISSASNYRNNWIDANEHQLLTSTIPFKGYDETTATTSYADYHIFYHYYNNTATAEKILKKPIIILDGFDPQDKRNYKKIYNEDLVYGDKKLGEELRKKGYDIILLNFPMTNSTKEQTVNNGGVYIPPINGKTRDGGTDYIERNAFLLVKLIQTINAKLTSNGYGNQKLVVVGPSMGGLISRYALAYMEKHNMNHNTGLWVSFDSPHLGANIPLAIQKNLHFFGYNGEQVDAKKAYKQKLHCPAARQMLIEQLDGLNGSSPFFSKFHNELKNNGLAGSGGFPQNLRKVALINGSSKGKLTNSPKETFLTLDAKKLGITFVKIRDRFMPPTNQEVEYFRGKATLKGWIYIELLEIWYKIKNINPNGSMDVMPGGTFDAQNTIKEEFEKVLKKKFNYLNRNWKIKHNHCFIPTISSLAFKNPNFKWSNSIDNRDLVQTGEIPFDNYYVPEENQPHIKLTEQSIFWLLCQLNGNYFNQSHKIYMSGSSILCTEDIYSIENLPSGAAVTWTKSDNLFYVSGQGTNTYKVEIPSISKNGSAWIKANISLNGVRIQLEKTLWVGKPEKPTYITGFPYNGMNFGSNTSYDFYTNPTEAGSYEWSVGGGTIVSGQGTNLITVLTGNANSGNNIYFTVSVKAVNACGCSPTFSRTGYVVKGEGPAYKVYPNPANDYVVISFDQQSMREYAERKGQKAQGCELVVYNGYNQIMYKTRTSEDEIQIDTRNFPAGTYYLHVTYGDKTEKSQLVIE